MAFLLTMKFLPICYKRRKTKYEGMSVVESKKQCKESDLRCSKVKKWIVFTFYRNSWFNKNPEDDEDNDNDEDRDNDDKDNDNRVGKNDDDCDKDLDGDMIKRWWRWL